MPPNTNVFLLGLAVGTGLLVFGLLVGYWLGRKSVPPDSVDRQQFLAFLRNLSNWTTEFSGDVSKYQSQLTLIDERFRGSASPPPAELQAVLSEIMRANAQLQQRLESAEQKLENQTDQISSYLTEARTDGLTGLFNRRAFDKATDGLFTDWTRKGQAFSMGLIDIDHFKHINDTYGHPAGDAVLKVIASTMQTELDETVCVARYGGEEFAMLTTASVQQCAAALEKLRERVGKLCIEHDGQVIPVTLSAGASHIDADDTIGKLVCRADEALYAAKLGGRNRVYLHDGTVCHLITKVAPASPPPAVNPHEQLSPEQMEAAQTRASRIQERLQRIVAEESQRLVER